MTLHAVEPGVLLNNRFPVASVISRERTDINVEAHALSFRGKNAQNVAQSLLDAVQIGAGRGSDEGQCGLCAVALRFSLDELTRAVDRVALFVQELFHANDILHVLATIETLSGIAFVGFELRKLSLPETEHIRGQRAKFGNFSDPEEKLLWDNDLFRWLSLRPGDCRPCTHERIVCRNRGKGQPKLET